jgi:2-iminobutanoate/2-iminopropanoate deaminase
VARIAGSTDGAPAPVGAFSQSARVGSVVWASGQGGFDPRTGELVGDDVGPQTRQSLRNVEAVLKAAGATLEDVVRVGVFITTPEDFTAMNEVYAQFWGDVVPPARTTITVGLPLPGMRVEIDAMAVVYH